MPDYRDLLRSVLQARLRECDRRASEIAKLLDCAPSDDQGGLVEALRVMARRNQVRTLEIMGEIAAFDCEYGSANRDD